MASRPRTTAAIMFIDVVDYSRLMSADEERTVTELQRHRHELIDPTVLAHRGRILKTLGDGLLVEFAGCSDALLCALSVQAGMAERSSVGPMQLRIGISFGDFIVEDGEVHGDVVNVAARLQTIADPGGVCVTEQVRSRIDGLLPLEFSDLGEPTLKGIQHPVRVFALGPHEKPPTRGFSDPLHLNRRCSIAVLPFQSMSGDQGQEYFADGVTEGIITALSCIRSLFVIARNSSFVYKDRRVDVREVARSLGVRYVLEGSVRRSAEKLRITAQLIEGDSGGHLWTSSFDGAANEVFTLQDRVAESVAGAIEPQILTAEIERARRKPTRYLTAYDYFLQALAHRAASTREDTREALSLLRKAIEIDPHFALALAHASMCLTGLRNQGYEIIDESAVAESVKLAEAAIEADPNDPGALTLAGHTIAAQTGQFDRGLAFIERALRINPNSSDAWARSAMVRVYKGDLETAVVHAHRSIALSPLDPNVRLPICALGYANLFSRKFDEAVRWGREALNARTKPEMAYRIFLAGAALGGGTPDLKDVAGEFMSRFPGFRIGTWAQRDAFRRPEQIEIMLSGLRSAGLPE
jgi:adenylate cyclase